MHHATESSVDRIYTAVQAIASGFGAKPGERINEGALAQSLNTSRTPLREALNRLVAEGYLTFQTGRGFFFRSLSPTEIFDLYETRVAIEMMTARLATERAKPADLAALDEIVAFDRQGDDGRSTEDLVTLDETFHIRVAEIAGNREMARVLDNINGRIRFVRWIYMERQRTRMRTDHAVIAGAIGAGDGARAADLMAKHIARRREEVIAAVREGYARLYVSETVEDA